MGIEFEVDQEANIVYAVSEGKISLSEWPQFVNRVGEEPNFKSGMHLVLDRRLEKFNRATDEEQERFFAWLQNSPTRPGRIAIIGPPSSIPAKGQMDDLSEKGFEIRLFHDLGAAKNWITSG